MVGMGCCRCCEKLGACCLDGVCTQETCADCEDMGGKFQGVDTECIGESEDECPCDPPADQDLCEKCADGVITPYCSAYGLECCFGVCREAPCCSGDCQWQPVWVGPDEWAGGWELVSACPEPECSCAEPDVESVGTEAEGLTFYTPCQECLVDGDCPEGEYCVDGVCGPPDCSGPCTADGDCNAGCVCEPCDTTERVLVRGNVSDPSEIQDVIDLLESLGFTDVRHEYQSEFEADTWLGVCCGDPCGYTTTITIGGVPYTVCACDPTRYCIENPLP